MAACTKNLLRNLSQLGNHFAGIIDVYMILHKPEKRGSGIEELLGRNKFFVIIEKRRQNKEL